MSKNISFNKLVYYIVLIESILFAICLFIFYGIKSAMPMAVAASLVIIFFVGISFAVVHYLTNRYLHGRIDLIYKVIRSSKVSRQPSDVSNKQGIIDTQHIEKRETDALGSVEEEVNKWIEEQQKEIESLKELENYRKEFLGNISHELKTPIFSVQGYIHTLLDGGINDQHINKRFLKKAAQNIERLETIVNDLEVISRLENATMSLDLQVFDLRALIVEVIEELEVQATSQDISITLKPDANQSVKVEADYNYINTVLVNLLVNSIKYGKEGGHTEVAFYNMDNFLLIEISDNGIGIDSLHLKHLFDRFYRVDKSRSRSRGGSGLGLSIVKHIIEAHGQTVNVRSTLGRGTTIGFTLQKAGE